MKHLNHRTGGTSVFGFIYVLASIVALALLIPAAVSAEGEFGYLDKWGEFGTGNGQFNWPYDVAIDSTGDIYVADTANYRIQKLDSEGSFIDEWGSIFDNPMKATISVAVDLDDNVYAAEKHEYFDPPSTHFRVRKLDSSGVVAAMWGDAGSGEGQFNTPHGIAVDSDSDVYIADTLNHRIQKFDSNGSFIEKWGSYCDVEAEGLDDCDGKFNYPSGIDVDSDGNVYVADYLNNRIQKFNLEGEFLDKWGSFCDVVDEGSDGCNGQFNHPSGLAVDSDGYVYVADYLNHRIQKFNLEGEFLDKWGSRCDVDNEVLNSCDGKFNFPNGIDVDSDGNVYTTEHLNHRIQKFGELSDDPAPDPNPKPTPPVPPSIQTQPSPAYSPTVKQAEHFDSGYGSACNLKITSPKVEIGKSRSAKLSRKDARRLFTKGLKGYVAWGKVGGKDVVCKKVRMTILERRGKRYYVPGTRIRVSKKRLGVKSFYRKVVRFLRGKRVGKLKQKRLKRKRRTNILFTEFRSLKLKKKALKNLRKRRYQGKFVVIYTAEVDGVTVKKTIVL